MAVNVRVEARPDRRHDVAGLLKRFKRAMQDYGVMHDYTRHAFYEKPCEKRNRKRRAAEAVRQMAQEGFDGKVKAKKKWEGSDE